MDKKPILSREEVDGFAARISLPLMDDERDALVREIEAAVLERVCGELIYQIQELPRSWMDVTKEEFGLGHCGRIVYAINRSKA